jgi:hypothetical protein
MIDDRGFCKVFGRCGRGRWNWFHIEVLVMRLNFCEESLWLVKPLLELG